VASRLAQKDKSLAQMGNPYRGPIANHFRNRDQRICANNKNGQLEPPVRKRAVQTVNDSRPVAAKQRA
jgi:hypothetical protein